MRRTFLLTLMACSIVGLLLLAATPAEAVHKGAGGIVCGSCHTMHNSQGGGSNDLGGLSGGSVTLLRWNEDDTIRSLFIHRFCFTCHSDQGAESNITHPPQNVKPPIVHATNDSWSGGDFRGIGAGGNFYPALDASYALQGQDKTTFPPGVSAGRAHSLGYGGPAPGNDGSGGSPNVSCLLCHDPHGTDTVDDPDVERFRNLKHVTVAAKANIDVDLTDADHTSWVGGVDGSNFAGYVDTADDGDRVIWPIFDGDVTATGDPATDAPNSNSYGGGANGISTWCGQCHDRWHEGLSQGATNKGDGQDAQGDWRRHPVDNILDER
jgi:cytochrome c553